MLSPLKQGLSSAVCIVFTLLFIVKYFINILANIFLRIFFVDYVYSIQYVVYSM